MMQQLYPQLEAVCRRFEELTTRLNQPETAARSEEHTSELQSR